MQCHYCDREASLDVEKNGVRVWLCDAHLRAQFEELADDLPERLDGIAPQE